MAGEWIKVEKATCDKPEVMRMSRALGIDRDAVLGKLVRVWMWFDANSVDGVVDGAVDADVDGLVTHPGFAECMRAVEWLSEAPRKAGLCLPNFERHNGETAKKRALSNRRQAKWRNASVDAPPSTSASTREEKRRSNPIVPSGQFLRFWSTWPKHPRKQAQGKCWSLWQRKDFDQVAAAILDHVESLKVSTDWRKDGGAYIPAPLVYLNQERWQGADEGTPLKAAWHP
jgi:hypothetical protein